jgi:hypothetical protein
MVPIPFGIDLFVAKINQPIAKITFLGQCDNWEH